jgi:hypothetical protein
MFTPTHQPEHIQPMVLVTIVSEEVLKESIISLLRNLKAQGFTVSRVEAEDRFGHPIGSSTTAAAPENRNVEIKVLVSAEVSDVILHTLHKYRGEHTIIAYRYNVEAIPDY